MARMTPSEAFVETMVANEVTDMFGIMGSAFMDAMDIFAPAGIRLIPVVHEQGATHMADGYARVSGRHGVTIGQNGPGISNCVTGIAAAFWAHSPVVIVMPEAGTMGIGLGGFQEAHQLPMFQEHTKNRGHVCNPARMAEFTGRCFDRAMSEMGPTQLNIPRDYVYGDIDIEIPQPQRLDRGPGGDKSLNEAADLLAKADVVLALGSRLGPFGTLPQHGMDYWPKDAKIIQVDADHTMLGLVKKISVGICGDAGRRHGLHRHRQHQLGRQQLPAIRAAAQLLRGHELG